MELMRQNKEIIWMYKTFGCKAKFVCLKALRKESDLKRYFVSDNKYCF